MKKSIWALALVPALIFSSPASASSYCKKANSEFKEQIKVSKTQPGLTEKYAYLKKCKPSSNKQALTCQQQWELETYKIQELARNIAWQIVLNNKKCFSPTLVAQVQLALKK